MLKTVLVALLAVYAFAQDETTTMGSTTMGTEEIPTTEALRPTEERVDPLLTGGNREYRKLVKGDLEQDPKSFRAFVGDANSDMWLSYWHDIPLFFNETGDARVINMIVEIVRGEGLKTEIDFSKPMNPITATLDEHGEPSDEHIDYIHHYGSVPQTFSDPAVVDSLTQLNGDGHALDIVEISDSMHDIGDIVPVKVLGLLGVLNDEKTIDYKLIAIDIHSSFADEINTLDDVERHFPDLLSATRGFFRYYRYPEKLYDIAFEGQYKDADNAMSVVKDRHDQWLNLIKNPSPPVELNTESHFPEAAIKANDEQWKTIVESA